MAPRPRRSPIPTTSIPPPARRTSLLSLQNGTPVRLGLLLQNHLAAQPRVLFCPSADQPLDTEVELAKVGCYQAQSSYYYRHGGNTNLFDTPGSTNLSPNLRLENLGLNRNGQPVRALVMDTLFLCPEDLASFGVKPRTHHRQKSATILFADGHASIRPNTRWRTPVPGLFRLAHR